MIPSPAELHYFVEVAGTLNISRAAERLGISQPSLSLAVKRLEDTLGAELLVRSKSGVNLTRAGQKFVAQARLLLHEWERLRSEALREEAEPAGRFIIGCHPSVALYTLPHVLPDLLERYPQLEIKLVHGLSRQVTDDVIGFKIDFGIVVNPVEHPDLVIKTLAKDEVTVWTAGGSEALAAAEAGRGVLICDPELLQTQSILKQLAKKGLAFPRVLTSSNLEVVTSLTAAGVGAGILPGRVAQRDAHLKLVPVKGGPKFQDRICLAYRADAQKSAASKTLLAAFATCLN